MHLTEGQIAAYDRDGYVVLPGLFSTGEVAAMKAELLRLSEIDTDHISREAASRSVKAIFRVHEPDGPTASPPFRRAVRSARLLGPARQLLRDRDLYLHHSKANRKAAIDGSVWQWHQDYGSWQHDGIRRPDLMTAMVAIDPSTEQNGCLYFVPQSHRFGRLEAELDERTTAYRLWVLPKQRMLELMEQCPDPVAITCRPGDAVLFHCNLFHGSGHNLSRHDRWQVYFCFNTVANRPVDVPQPRPDYVRSRNWRPLEMADEPVAATG